MLISAQQVGDFDRLGAFLRAARIRRGLTLEQLAARTHVSKNFLQRIEKGGNVSLLVLKRIAPELQLTSIPFMEDVSLVVAESGEQASAATYRAAARRIIREAALILADPPSGAAESQTSEADTSTTEISPEQFADRFARLSPAAQAEFVDQLFERSRRYGEIVDDEALSGGEEESGKRKHSRSRTTSSPRATKGDRRT